MKRLAAAVMAAGLSAAIFAGCGSSTSTGQSTETQTMQTPTDTSQDEQTTKAASETSTVSTASTVSEASKTSEASTATEAESMEDSSVSSVADDSVSEEASDIVQMKKAEVWEAPKTGITFKVPENIKDIKGQFFLLDNGEDTYGDDIFTAFFSYLPRTDEEGIKFGEVTNAMAEIPPEYLKFAYDYFLYQRDVSTVVAVKEGMDPGKVSQLSEGTVTELGAAGGYNYYYVVPTFDSISQDLEGNISEELYAEFKALAEQASGYASYITLQGAKRPLPEAQVGTEISFETTDIDGNAVKSEDLFKDHKVTMIYIWETFSDTCKNELPQLEALNKSLAEKDCQIIGICADTVKGENVVSEAQKILAEKGVTYTNITATDDILAMLPVIGYPTTYLIDSKSRVLAVPLSDANVDQYTLQLEESLSAIKK